MHCLLLLLFTCLRFCFALSVYFVNRIHLAEFLCTHLELTTPADDFLFSAGAFALGLVLGICMLNVHGWLVAHWEEGFSIRLNLQRRIWPCAFALGGKCSLALAFLARGALAWSKASDAVGGWKKPWISGELLMLFITARTTFKNNTGTTCGSSVEFDAMRIVFDAMRKSLVIFHKTVCPTIAMVFLQ